jgi:hypothetical protein
MTRRPARVTQVEIDRVIRSAKKARATEVEVKLDSNGPWLKIVLSGDKPIAESDDDIVI